MGTVPASVLEGTSCPCRTIWASQRAPRRRKCRGIARSRTNCDAKNPTQGNVEKGDFVHGKEARVKPALKVLLSGNQNVQRGEIRKGGATKPRETGESTVSAVSRPHGMGRVLLLLLLLAVETILLISNAEGLPAPNPSRLPVRPGTSAGSTVRGGGATGSSAGLAMTRSELAVVVGNGLAGLLRGFDTVFETDG
jgi:hypothetical protein